MLMKYQIMKKAVFLSRPNRFIAQCLLEGEEITAHVKNTGRCRELLLPGCTVWLEHSAASGRKTSWSLIAVEKETERGRLFINMDSQAPNAAAYEAVMAGKVPFSFLPEGRAPRLLKREFVFGDSRFDLYGEEGENRFLIEVKGVTLEEGGNVFFPDAPTVRGVKHLEGLCWAAGEGYRCGVLFVVQMEANGYFAPNWKTHSDFGYALLRAREYGVELLAMCCKASAEGMEITHTIPICLEQPQLER